MNFFGILDYKKFHTHEKKTQIMVAEHMINTENLPKVSARGGGRKVIFRDPISEKKISLRKFFPSGKNFRLKISLYFFLSLYYEA